MICQEKKRFLSDRVLSMVVNVNKYYKLLATTMSGCEIDM